MKTVEILIYYAFSIMFLYCRLCAEPKAADEMLNFDEDDRKCTEVLNKLSTMSVDVSNRNNLPKTVCFYCYDSLNKAYDFVDKVKKAQEILDALFTNNDSVRFAISDDDGQVFEELFSEPFDIAEPKTDIPGEKKDTESPKLDLDVKIEPKEEISPEIAEEVLEPALNAHIVIKTTENPAVPKQKWRTRRTGSLRKNKTNSWKEYPWFCNICNVNFLDLETLRSHCKGSHSKCSAFGCADCTSLKKQVTFEAFLNHVRKHRQDLGFCCPYCDQIPANCDLTEHINTHYLKSNVSCEFCGEILENQECLQQHISDYVTIKPRRKPRRKAGVPLTVEDLTCHLCKKVYKNPNSLRDHIKRHDERKRNYTCDRCGKNFYNKGTLTSHVMNHDNNRPHMCRICNKSFLFPNMLRRHVEMHSGVKPFSCEVCGRCFRLQYQLNAHKIIHTNAMPHVCQYCNKAFRFKQILKSHERQHTGVKPYSCSICCMEFSNWSNYNKHMKRRHNIDTSKKKITPSGVFPVNPETGQIIDINVQGMEEWKSKVMVMGKRGKKKAIKQETVEKQNVLQ